MSIIKSRVKT